MPAWTAQKNIRTRSDSGDSSRTDLPGPEDVDRWLARGDVTRLEQLILDGHSELLEDAVSDNQRTKVFLKSVPTYRDMVSKFLMAITEGDQATVKQCVGFRDAVRARHPSTAATALHLSVIWTHLDLLRFLLRKLGGQFINAQDGENRTALHYAAVLPKKEANLQLYEVLRTHGANETLVDSEGYSPLYYLKHPSLLDMDRVRENNKYPVEQIDHVDVQILHQDVPRLEENILNGDWDILKERTFPVGTEHIKARLETFKRRIRAIQDSAAEGDEAALKQLVDKRRLAVCRTETGATPLHIAVAHNRLSIAEYLLLIFPQCVDEKDKGLRTPLHYAACTPHGEKFTSLLLRSGASPGEEDELGCTPEYYQKTPEAAADIYESLNKNCYHQKRYSHRKSRVMESDIIPAESKVQKWIENEDFSELEDLMMKGDSKTVRRLARKYPEIAGFLRTFQQTQVTSAAAWTETESPPSRLHSLLTVLL